jgi:hypothetical protein
MPKRDRADELVSRIRRNQLMRSFGHNPLAPNCHWHDPSGLDTPKAICEKCRKINARFFGGGRIFG